MQGSYSIKYVLPTLFHDDPARDYHNLEGIHNGGEASEAFAKMATMAKDEIETIERSSFEILCPGHLRYGQGVGKPKDVSEM